MHHTQQSQQQKPLRRQKKKNYYEFCTKCHSNSPQPIAVNVTIKRSSRTFEKCHHLNENAILIGSLISSGLIWPNGDLFLLNQFFESVGRVRSSNTMNFGWRNEEKCARINHTGTWYQYINDSGPNSPLTTSTPTDWHMISNIHFSCERIRSADSGIVHQTKKRIWAIILIEIGSKTTAKCSRDIALRRVIFRHIY